MKKNFCPLRIGINLVMKLNFLAQLRIGQTSFILNNFSTNRFSLGLFFPGRTSALSTNLLFSSLALFPGAT